MSHSQTLPPEAPSLPNPQTQEWEGRARDWLMTMPKRRNVSTDEMDGWIDSNLASLPEDLKSQPRTYLYQRILSMHKIIRRSHQEAEANQVEPSQARFQRSDHWMPVYSWLESLDKNEIVKPNEIIEWLTENPGIREQLQSRHSRHQVMHYIQRCHFKMLRRRERLRKRRQAMQAPPARPPVKAANNGVTTAAVPLRYKFSGTVLNDHDILFKKNEALRRYELLTDLQGRLMSFLSSLKQGNNSKELGSENANNQSSDAGVEEGNGRVVAGAAS